MENVDVAWENVTQRRTKTVIKNNEKTNRTGKSILLGGDNLLGSEPEPATMLTDDFTMCMNGMVMLLKGLGLLSLKLSVKGNINLQI